MAKSPREGKVKTRLAKSIGPATALRVYERLLSNVANRCLPVENDSYDLGCFIDGINGVQALIDFEFAFPGYAYYCNQSAGNLGDRMHRATIQLFDRGLIGAKKGMLIGADIPDLDRTIIAEAFLMLDHCDVVWGPTFDGGYYLVALRCPQPELFKEIQWGSSQVLQASLSRAQQLGLNVELLTELRDIDNLEDLKLFPELAASADHSV